MRRTYLKSIKSFPQNCEKQNLAFIFNMWQHCRHSLFDFVQILTTQINQVFNSGSIINIVWFYHTLLSKESNWIWLKMDKAIQDFGWWRGCHAGWHQYLKTLKITHFNLSNLIYNMQLRSLNVSKYTYFNMEFKSEKCRFGYYALFNTKLKCFTAYTFKHEV